MVCEQLLYPIEGDSLGHIGSGAEEEGWAISTDAARTRWVK